jgi:biopolymer transport protein ExbB/TolQ
MNILSSIRRAIMRSPIVWGLLACAAFYGLVHGGPLGFPVVHRYFTHHPVEYGETMLFSIGLAALLLRLADVFVQRANLLWSPWRNIAVNDVPPDKLCDELRAALDALPAQRQDEYYVGRLRAAVEYAARQDSTEGLYDELRYLADVDATRSHFRFGLFRVIVWAIPILGFLGTVIGITMALNGIDPKALDTSMAQVMVGLGLKFDTTAVALSLSMVLMFLHFFVERSETGLLWAVDRQVERELAHFLPSAPSAGGDGQVAAVRRMAEVVVSATDRLVQRQAQLWQSSIDAAAARWTGMAESAGANLTRALEESLALHAQRLAASEETVAEQGRRQWEKIAQAELQHVQGLAALQAAMAQQAESVERTIQATRDVEQLEDALNRNLSALAGAKNFEQTVLGLAAAIHLLNARLAESPAAHAAVQLESKRRTAKAA